MNENGSSKNYTTNALNQYTNNSGFTPTYDKDGNQTKIKTSTGEWEVTYNGENRPVKFAQGTKIIEMKYDYMGRRIEYISKNGNSLFKQRRYVYSDYTVVQELLSTNALEREFVWDPTAGMATKPLIFKLPQRGLALFYTHDGNKNISDLVYWATANGIGAHYEYSPFGAVTTSTCNTRVTNVDIRTENPFRFSSEYHDDELGLIYYNYRHYNPADGRWISRDPMEEAGGINLYGFLRNSSLSYIDILGNSLSRYPAPFVDTNPDNPIIINPFDRTVYPPIVDINPPPPGLNNPRCIPQTARDVFNKCMEEWNMAARIATDLAEFLIGGLGYYPLGKPRDAQGQRLTSLASKLSVSKNLPPWVRSLFGKISNFVKQDMQAIWGGLKLPVGYARIAVASASLLEFVAIAESIAPCWCLGKALAH